LPDEPEAVTEAEQRELTRQAQREQSRRDRETWIAARNTIRAALATLDVPAYALVARDVRLIRRTLDRIDARLRP
jgi:hypothetical protein